MIMASISGSDLLRLLKFHRLPFIWSVLSQLVLIKTLHLPPLKRFGGPKWGFSPSAEVAIEYSSSQHLRLLGGVGVRWGLGDVVVALVLEGAWSLFH